MSQKDRQKMINGIPSIVTAYRIPEGERPLYDYYESAARKFCELMMADPDDEVETRHQAIVGAYVTLKRWMLHVHDLQQFDLKFIALASTQGERAVGYGQADSTPEPN